MDQLEDALKKALARMDPPAGFEFRVAARLATRQPARRFAAWAAAGLAFASFAGVAIYQQQQQRKAVDAGAQLLLALRVTGRQLDTVRTRINHSENRP